MLVGIRLDRARIDGEAFATDDSLCDPTPDRRLEQLTQQIAISETAMLVL